MEQGDQTRNIFQEENTEKSVNNVAISKSVDEMNSDDKEEAKKLGAEITEISSEEDEKNTSPQATQQPSQSKPKEGITR